jgi:hypothetical protein
MKRRVSPMTRGSCMERGQQGRAPAGTSNMTSAILSNSRRHWEVKSRGHTMMWFKCGRFSREIANSSKAARAAAGGGDQRNQVTVDKEGCWMPSGP